MFIVVVVLYSVSPSRPRSTPGPRPRRHFRGRFTNAVFSTAVAARGTILLGRPK